MDDRINAVAESITGFDTNLQNVNTTLTNSLNNLSAAAVKLTGSQTVSGAKTFSGGATFSGTTTHSGALNCSGAATFTGVTKVPNSATVGTAIATAAISKAADGYVKLGNGIIIQWGSVTGSAGAKTVTFPLAFTSTNVRVVTQCLYTSQTNGYQGTVKSVNKTTLTCYQSYASGIFWIAIGY